MSVRGASAPPGVSRQTIGAPHPGDEGQRITVQRPRTLQELQSYAQKHFGHKGKKLGLWHQGRQAIQHQRHVDPVKHEDVVVVTWSGEKDLYNHLTTHQADFVRHPLNRPRAQSGPRTPGPTIPFEGQSSYAYDFVKHPLSKTDPVAARGTSWRPTDAPTGTTTYSNHYVRHPLKGPEPPMVVAARQTLPFEGKSSYAQDFVKHPIKPAVVHRPEERMAPPGTFDAITTYASAYVGHMPRPRTPREGRSAPTSLPFHGNSEYKQEYIKKDIALPERLHLEPELQGVDIALAATK
mmetsp:Transcript_53524/g.98995  ORF Transcript_53524/g.98995 Transcript_53524/m.98995 type:complete len:294 (-) Transcript_53524:100-981(-)